MHSVNNPYEDRYCEKIEMTLEYVTLKNELYENASPKDQLKIFDLNEEGLLISDAEISNRNSSLLSVLNELSINVLLLVNNAFSSKSKYFEGGLNTIIKYLINFWSQISMIFQNLIKPEYKIKIAGIAVDYDDQVLDFSIKHAPIEWGFSKALKYDDAFNEMSKWLQRKSLDCTLIESYSIIITHTPRHHDCYMQFNSSCAVFSKWKVVQEATAYFVEQISQIPLLIKLKNIGLLIDNLFFDSNKFPVNKIATM